MSWYCTGLKTFRSPNKCDGPEVVGSPTCATGTKQGDECIGKVGSPTCATGTKQGDECIGKVGDPTCATGTKQGDECIGKVGDPTCATGTKQGDECIGKVGSPTCATGTKQGEKCVDTKAPTCQQGKLQGTKCVTTTTATTPPRLGCESGHTLQNGQCKHLTTDPPPIPTPAGVECPDGYQYGTGTLGSEPPYTAPAGFYWVTKDSTSSPSPLVPHTCWSIAIGSCPVGTTFGPSGYSPIRSNPDYPPGLPSAPDGKEWNWASGNAHYGCYKLVEKGAGVWNRLWSHLQTAYDWADYYLYTAVCGTPGARQGIASIVGEAASWRALNDARQWIRDNAATIGSNAKKATNVVLLGLCHVADEPERPNSGSDAQSAPAPASGLSPVAGDGQVAVSWSASADAPEAGFGYRVLWKTGTQSWGQAVDASQFEDLDHGDDLATSYTITGLVNGSAYKVRVAAFNDDGFSDWIDATATPTAAPGAASGLALVAGDKQLEVSWSASADIPAAGFGYRVVWKTGTQSWGQAVAASQFEDLEHGDDLATSYAITGLSNGSAYKVRVAAFNPHGFSDWITATATPLGAAPGPPSALALSAGDGQIEASWSASADTPEAGFGYRVQWKTRTQSWAESAADSQFEDLEHGDDLATSYAITGLSNGVAHSVRVAAFKDGAFSDWITATATLAGAVPGPPSRLALAAGDAQIEVSWSASADTPEAGFGYRVVWKTGTQSWAKAVDASQFEDLDHGDDLATSYAITGLVNGSAYRVRVAAFNGGGFSKWITATATPTAPPEGLSDVQVSRTYTNSNSGQTHARVVWEWTGDNPLGFQLRAERSGAEATSLNEGQETRVTWLDLPKGGTGDYTIKVRAIFSYIDGTYGDWIEITQKAE